jgi:hypothetical protein
MSDQSISHIVDPNKGTPYYLGKALMTDSDFIYNLEEIEKERLIIISMGDKLNIDYTNLGYKETSSKDFCGNIYITTFEKPN